MTTYAQGLYKTISYKKQSALGTPATGAGATYLRRETAQLNKMTDTFDANEIVTHQQDTGVAFGISKTQGELSDVLSAGSFAPWFGSLNRRDMTAGIAITGLSITIAGSGPFTLTRSAGSNLTDGFKIGDVVRITAGTYTGIARDVNCLVTGVTALVLTVIVANGKVLGAQGPITSSTITVIGKKSVTQSTGQTNDYYSVEEWLSDISKSRLYSDVQIAAADISIPATGFASVKFTLLGLLRSKASSQQQTSPTAAPTTAILAAGNAKVILVGTQTLVGTSLSLKLDGGLTHGEPVIGSSSIADIVKGDIKVSGTVTNLKADEVYSDFFDAQSAGSIIAVLFADTSDTSDFIGFTVARAKLTKDEIDDGKKQIVSTHDFVGEYNSAGGAAIANDTGIIAIQDSAA
jgi:hypothetical protein